MQSAPTFLLATVEPELKVTVQSVPTFLIATVEPELKVTVSALHSQFSFSYSISLTR